MLVEGQRYRTPAHGVWNLLLRVEAQLGNVTPLGWAALAASGLLCLAGLTWAYTRGRHAAAGFAER